MILTRTQQLRFPLNFSTFNKIKNYEKHKKIKRFHTR